MAVKAERKALEKRIAPLHSKNNVQIVDIGKYPVYRYDHRLVAYYIYNSDKVTRSVRSMIRC